MRRLGVLCTLLLAAGCEATTKPPASLAGAWPLRTVNNSYLPTQWKKINLDTYRRVSVDSLIMTADGQVRRWTFVNDSTITWGQVGRSGTALRDSGTYTRDGTTVSIQLSREAGPVTGFVDGTGLSVSFDGLMYRYARP